MRRKFAVLLTVIGLAAVGSALTASPAAAGPSCRSGYHCVFYATIGGTQYDFFNTDRNFTDNFFPNGEVVNDNVWAASNSSTGGFESHYYYDINPSTSSRLVFCVNPGSFVNASQLSDDGVNGNGVGQRDEMSALLLRGTTSVRCF